MVEGWADLAILSIYQNEFAYHFYIASYAGKWIGETHHGLQPLAPCGAVARAPRHFLSAQGAAASPRLAGPCGCKQRCGHQPRAGALHGGAAAGGAGGGPVESGA